MRKLKALVRSELKCCEVRFGEPPDRPEYRRANQAVLQMLAVAERYGEDDRCQLHGRRERHCDA